MYDKTKNVEENLRLLDSVTNNLHIEELQIDLSSSLNKESISGNGGGIGCNASTPTPGTVGETKTNIVTGIIKDFTNMPNFKIYLKKSKLYITINSEKIELTLESIWKEKYIKNQKTTGAGNIGSINTEIFFEEKILKIKQSITAEGSLPTWYCYYEASMGVWVPMGIKYNNNTVKNNVTTPIIIK